MKIKLLQARHGDAIHLRVKEKRNKYRNILIDGGPQDTWIQKGLKNKMESGPLKQLVDQIRDRQEFIDLLILTHIDDDHIGGVLKWFDHVKQDEQDVLAKDLVKKVWYNSGRLISEHFQQPENEDNNLVIHSDDSFDTSVKQGVSFEKYIEEHQIWDRRLIKSGDIIELFGLKFTILSPTEDKLKKLLSKWEKEAPILDTSGKTDYDDSLLKLIETDKFKSDDSVPNGSSIAFMVENEDRKILFFGDAHPQPIIDTLKKGGYTAKNPLYADFVKVSHHGSKKNTNNNLLDLIQSDNFLISTNGDEHGLPDKTCLARIINKKPSAKLYFNYPALADEIFSGQDFLDFPDFKVCDAQEQIEV